MPWNDANLIKVLQDGGVAVMPTDTIYGLVGRAENSDTVNRIYNLKKRTPKKPCIILIGDINEIEKFSVNLSKEQKNKLKEYWQIGSVPVSIILDCLDENFSYLHRGTKTLAFRLPSPQSLRDLLLSIGPLIVPSANPEGLPPAQNISEAKKYFGDAVDFYLDGGEIFSKASKLIKLHKDGSITIIRE